MQRERNLCSDPNPGTVGTARVLCRFCLRQRIHIREDERLVSAGSGLWRQMKAGAQRWRCPARSKRREAETCCCASATSNLLSLMAKALQE